MRLNLWMIANRLEGFEIDVCIKKNKPRTLRSARFAHATDCLYVYQDGEDTVCADGNDYIRILNIEKNVAFEIVQGIFDFYNAWADEMDNALVNFNKSELIQILWKGFKNPVVLFDDNYHVLTMTRQYGYSIVDEEWDYLLKFGCKSYHAVQSFKGASKVHLQVENASEIIALQNAGKGWRRNMTLPVVVADTWRGELYVVEMEHELNYGDALLLQYVCAHMKRFLSRSISRKSTLVNTSALLDIIIQEPVNAEELRRVISYLGWKEDDSFRILLFYINNGEEAQDMLKHLQICAASISATFSNMAVISKDEYLILVLNDMVQEKKWTKSAMESIINYNDAALVGGYSVRGIMNIRYSYEQAFYLYNRRGDFEERRIYFYPKAVDRLMEGIWKEPMGAESIIYNCHPDVIRLWKQDLESGSNQIETVETFIQFERSLVNTAATLHVHRSTLIYRIKKIEESITGGLDDPYSREYIMISIRILKYFEDKLAGIAESQI